MSRRVRTASGVAVLDLADAVVDRHRWVAYELVYHHGPALEALDIERVERLGRELGDWGAVDAFARYVAGPAWRLGGIDDADVRRWAAERDRWRRRAALVSTVPLNLRAAGGTGDARRTLDICGRLAGDRDDLVVKALSWALRELVQWDPGAVRAFLLANQAVLAPRVAREVDAKLETGRKRRASSRRA